MKREPRKIQGLFSASVVALGTPAGINLRESAGAEIKLRAARTPDLPKVRRIRSLSASSHQGLNRAEALATIILGFKTSVAHGRTVSIRSDALWQAWKGAHNERSLS